MVHTANVLVLFLASCRFTPVPSYRVKAVNARDGRRRVQPRMIIFGGVPDRLCMQQLLAPPPPSGYGG